ncbi:FAD-dependent oxidoreductase [Yamadazyma tenuis]|uniref:Nucleotide-binding domain-containing protein n=1 Tax=Candida tenuis (strain ATCC 10573 / BCRC 21748 / CBS 615 / JCM 9827 / NBRC 10315 / NRRL Y-1498 / VKM Y-70) TaxID=590646 RepID=G3BDX0_CANTC|nr:nucleotide-binding domain-containing protein [Yamadazyma tenuis ATCC 10573]EGV60402.1 nucleotide-binding domain-containing protein [Yamadazyma tenuis ATCC 10573]WEJ94351.1 FAD-dependent oxidoreductase [Yamadazyma tenuis]
MSDDYDYDVLVVGCGVFGLSTCLELSKQGHKVLGLDAYPVPSELSAAKDYNKIIRVEYPDELSAKLAVEALRCWENDELYKPYFVKSGRLTLTPGDSTSIRSQYENKSLEILAKLGVTQSFEKLTTPKQVADTISHFKKNNLPAKFNSTYNADCGTGLSADALKAVYERATTSGAQFVFGDDGRAVSIKSNEVRVKSGKIFTAKKIVVTAGASTGLIIPLDNQTKVFGTFVTHIKLTDAEYEKYKDMPIFFSAEYGYFFPPDKVDHVIKIGVTTCDAWAEIDHPFEAGNKLRAPRYTVDHPNETFPLGHEKDIKVLLNLVVPELADHELVDSKVCWIADSCDSYFLIDECPYYKDVIVATGDSSHAFKFLPTIGKYISQKVNGALPADLSETWKWRSNPSFDNGANTKSRFPRPHYNLEEIKFIKSKL